MRLGESGKEGDISWERTCNGGMCYVDVSMC